MATRLPDPPQDYTSAWANQYTKALENAIVQLQTTIQNLQLLVLPNYTTAQKNTLPNRKGQLVFDTTLGKACVNNGSGWETITSV